MSDKLVRIKNRYDTASNWKSNNPVLAAGEIGIDSTYNVMKVGNGSDKWNKLDYINSRAMIMESLFFINERVDDIIALYDCTRSYMTDISVKLQKFSDIDYWNDVYSIYSTFLLDKVELSNRCAVNIRISMSSIDGSGIIISYKNADESYSNKYAGIYSVSDYYDITVTNGNERYQLNNSCFENIDRYRDTVVSNAPDFVTQVMQEGMSFVTIYVSSIPQINYGDICYLDGELYKCENLSIIV